MIFKVSTNLSNSMILTEHTAQDMSAKVSVQDCLQNGFQLLSMWAAKKSNEPCRGSALFTLSGQPWGQYYALANFPIAQQTEFSSNSCHWGS